MPIIVTDGQEGHIGIEWISREIYQHYQSGRDWDSQNFSLVDIGGILSVWITEGEKQILSKLKNIDEIDQFATSINVTPINREKFIKWKDRV